MSFGQTNTSGATLSQMTSQGTPRLAYGRSYAPINPENVTSVRVHGRNTAGAAGASVIVGIYDITAGRAGASLVHSVSITIPTSATAAWVSVSTSYALLNTKTYAYAFVSGGTPQWEISRQTTSSMLESHSTVTNFTMPATWASGSASTFDALVEIVTVPAGSTINTINGSAYGEVKAGSSGNTVTTTASFVPTSGSHGGKAISAIAGSAGSYTFTSATYVDGAAFPEPDTSQTFTITDGVETLNAASVFASPYDCSSVVLASIDNTNPKNITYYIPTASAGDRIVFPLELVLGSPTFGILSDGSGFAATTGLRTLWHWNSEDSIMTRLNVTVNEAGEVTSVNGLTALGLTARGLTARGLTARGL